MFPQKSIWDLHFIVSHAVDMLPGFLRYKPWIKVAENSQKWVEIDGFFQLSYASKTRT